MNTGPATGIDFNTQWYRTAVFYEVLVRAFHDSTGSGSGDLRGLIDKLDYLQWLGIDCIWIPPIFASPGRDGGYDISDFTAIDPSYGSVADFAALIDAAHCRGMRVIADFVLNHTSDAHPWFQASRSDPDGEFGDFYVWRDDDSGYRDARIIFVDTEKSNWSYDVVRGQYYWHRFFSHQPDLNYDNPSVQAAILDVARHWLRLGLDGFRLDAVPYLFEGEGTSCENLPATHVFLARLRAMVDTEFPGRLLLAEANQQLSEVVNYFGTQAAPECHMAFHFPLMPRIFAALRDNSATAIKHILATTPAIPAGTQWAIFLRNHDELTLEMVSNDERAAMYGWYAPDPRMRANVGIRRRLAPLLAGSRPELELAHGLLLSLPGSPCLYYGDEIGMGDNIWLPDRDAVRTPMQWTPERNAGFSSADPGRLYLPAINSLAFNYQAANVKVARAQPASLLHWLRNLLALRRSHPVFGVGTCTVIDSEPAVLAFLRRNDDETILCINNLSAHACGCTIRLPGRMGNKQLVAIETGYPVATTDRSSHVTFTLGPRQFFWLLVQ